MTHLEMSERAVPKEHPAFIIKALGPISITEAGSVDAPATGLAAIRLPGTPGWLTGEPLEVQGIETTMPNLPEDLDLPDLSTRNYRLRVQALGSAAVHVQIAPPEHPMWTAEPTWPGIMVQVMIEPTATTPIRIEGGVGYALGRTSVSIGSAPFTLAVHVDGRRVLRTGERLRQVAGFPMAPPVIGRGQTDLASLKASWGSLQQCPA